MGAVATIRERFAGLPAPGCQGGLVLGVGTIDDYARLSEHHYKAKRPATVTRVLTLRDPQPSACGRYLKRWEPGRVVGVLVESMPSLNCRMRDWAVHERYQAVCGRRQNTVLLNREVRCISRVVVHPQWRGLGLAVRLVQAALEDSQTIFTEALAAMGKVHPFFERAGMTAFTRPTHGFDARLRAALASAGFEDTDLARLDAVESGIGRMREAKRRWLLSELDRWYRQVCGRSGVCSHDSAQQLRAARARLLCEPVYYLHDNRVGRGVVG